MKRRKRKTRLDRTKARARRGVKGKFHKNRAARLQRDKTPSGKRRLRSSKAHRQLRLRGNSGGSEYFKGFNDAYNEGYNAGFAIGFEDGHQTAYEQQI